MSARARTRLVRIVAGAALLASGALSCAHAPRGAVGDGEDAIVLVVQNDSFADMDVWVTGYGMQSRLGIVGGNLTERFTLGEWVSREPELHIVATPFGRPGRPVSESVSVRRGDTIEFTIGMHVSQTHVLIR